MRFVWRTCLLALVTGGVLGAQASVTLGGGARKVSPAEAARAIEHGHSRVSARSQSVRGDTQINPGLGDAGSSLDVKGTLVDGSISRSAKDGFKIETPAGPLSV